MKLQVLSGKKGYTLLALDGLRWETERKGSPGKLTFDYIDDGKFKIEEGNVVRLSVDKKKLFFGYVFKITRDKSNKVSILCYDQMRYLKNKDTYIFNDTTSTKIIKAICKDYGIKTGTIVDTKFNIKSVIYEGKTLLDIMQDSLEMTLTNTKKLYVLYDAYGKLTVQKASKMIVPLLIDAETAQSYSYDSSIDEETYNRIVLEHKDSKTEAKTYWTAEDKKTQKKWGTLQYFEKISETETAQNKANTLLKLYNTKTKHLTITDAIGDLRIRAGSTILVNLKIGKEKVKKLMVVDSCTHIFNENEHWMTLKVIGGGFIA